MKINIGFGINDGFCQHCACTMASILVNSDKNDEYNFYIVCDKLSDKNINNLEKLKKIRDFNITYIPVNEDEFEDMLKSTKRHYTHFFIFKFFKLENVDKILYLDADVIVREDIKTLYRTDIEDYYVAGAKDVRWRLNKQRYSLNTYINSGVLLINIKRTRKMDFTPDVSFFIKVFGSKPYGDQQLINFAFREKILEFDIKYNYSYPFDTDYDQEYYRSLAKNPSIVHYISKNKPWMSNSGKYMRAEYFNYLKYTPYYKDFLPTFQIDEKANIISRLDDILRLIS